MRKISTFHIAAALLAALWFTPSTAGAAPKTTVNCSGGYVALTFDDGPTPDTYAVLDALRQNGLKATFFLVGFNVQLYPEIALRIVRDGHQVGNHSWDHTDLTTLTPAEIDWQLRATNDIIRQATGVTPRFVRPPYGNSNETVRGVMAANGLTEVIWSQDSWDWAEVTPMDILNQLSLVPPGGTLAMHDWAPNTVLAIPSFYWYFRVYWAATPICAGRLAPTTNVQPVMDWLGNWFFAHAVRW